MTIGDQTKVGIPRGNRLVWNGMVLLTHGRDVPNSGEPHEAALALRPQCFEPQQRPALAFVLRLF
jgi:hypothetical protein